MGGISLESQFLWSIPVNNSTVLSIFDFHLFLLIHSRIYLVVSAPTRDLSWHNPFTDRIDRSTTFNMRFNYLFALLTLGGVAVAAPVAAEAGACFPI